MFKMNWIMKKHLRLSLVFVAIISMIAACQVVEQPLTTPESGEMIEMTVVATQGNGAQTKTHLGSPVEGNYPVLWDDTGESLEIIQWSYLVDVPNYQETIENNDIKTDYKVSEVYELSDDKKEATFEELRVPVMNDTYVYFDYGFVSPGNKVKASNGRYGGKNPRIKVELSAIQSPLADSYDPSVSVVVGHSFGHTSQPEVVETTLSHVMAYAKMTISNLSCGGEKINNIEFSSNKEIYGSRIVYDLEEDTQSLESPTKSIAIDVSELELSPSSFDVYFVSAPTTFEGGDEFTVTVFTDQKVYTKTMLMTSEKLLILNKGEITSFSVSFDDIDGTSLSEPEEVTVSQFISKENSILMWYKLTGRISNITNETFGNFDLTDAEGNSIYVYGLTSTKQESSDQSFSSLNLKEGDVVTLIGNRTNYHGEPQVGNAYYESHFGLDVQLGERIGYEANSTTTLTINSDVGKNWSIAISDGAGFTVNSSSGTIGNEGTVTVTLTAASANEGTEDKDLGDVTVTVNGYPVTLEVIQEFNPSVVSAKYYTLVTDVNQVTDDGKYLLVYESEDGTERKVATLIENNILQVTDIAYVDGKGYESNSTVDSYQITITSVESSSYDYLIIGGKYIAKTLNSTNLYNNETSLPNNNEITRFQWLISIDDSYVDFKNIAYETYSLRYKSGTGFKAYTGNKKGKLYKLAE